MNLETILSAEKEAKKFLEKAKLARKRIGSDGFGFLGSKETASLRRQSMELSNALVDLRRHD